MSDSTQQAQSQSVSRSAFSVSMGNVFSLVAGFGSQIVIAAIFGAGVEMDAFLTALAIPLYLQSVLLSGLSFVLIPAFIEARTDGETDAAWALVGTFFWLTLGILSILALFGAVFNQELIALYAPGLDAAKATLTADMLVVVMFSVPLFGIASLTTGVQNARNNFFWPATAGAFASIGNLLVLWLYYEQIGPMALAWGYLLGIGMQAAITAVPVLQHGWKYLVPLKDPRLKEMLWLIMPLILFGVFTKASPILERFFASNLPDGELSYLGYSAKISRIFASLLLGGISTAIFPTMSRAYSEEGDLGLEKVLKHGLRLTLAVGLPIVVILNAISVPFIGIVFERGAFTRETTIQVARIMPIVVLGMVIIPMFGNILTRTFYVRKDTKTVPIVSAASILVYILGGNWFTSQWGYAGLATAQTLYRGVGTLILVLLLFRQLQFLKFRRVAAYSFVYGGLAILTFLTARGLSLVLVNTPDLLQLIVISLAAGLVYVLLLLQVDPKITADLFEVTGLMRLMRLLKVQRLFKRVLVNFRLTRGILSS